MKEEEILGILPLHIRTIIKQADINWDELQEIRLRIQKPVILKYNAKTCYLSEQGKITTRKFAEFDGHVVEYELETGEQIVVDTGHLAAMTASCTMEIKSVPGVKNMLFGGEGVFNTILTGPGKVWLQTMPISNVAGVLSPYFPSSSK